MQRSSIRRFVARILRPTLLVPAIMEAILDGRQAPQMQWQTVLPGLPQEWEEQLAMVEN